MKYKIACTVGVCHLPTHPRAHPHTGTHTYTGRPTHRNACAHTGAHTHTIHTGTHTHTHTHHTHIGTPIHRHASARTILAHVHAGVHTHERAHVVFVNDLEFRTTHFQKLKKYSYLAVRVQFSDIKTTRTLQ